MSRLIDADTLPISSGWIEQGDQKVHITFAYEYDIQNSPTVNAVPVKHGHWIVENEYKRFCTILQCSECGKCTFGYPNDNKYCYNCGALMDEVTE